MKNEVEQIALQNDMSIEFVTWFFNEKKVGCGNVWFMMMAAMWEGWKGRSIEMEKLAAENVAIREQSEEVYAAGYNHGHLNTVDGITYAGCVKDDFYGLALQVMAEVETPATDRFVAGIKADGVEEFAAHLRANDNGASVCKMIALGAEDFAKQLREGDNK
ncbi:TPA: hypothetical protein MFB44_004589 [Klebsiella pneumoniae]|uniref:hypothetical protein n=1 Tax=Klebsiella pneumoniae TaxID=573 RepID=UPI0019CA907D|nr:hypothetical protein [Klebsiella pneumoniae]MBD7416647.1 hypothetical protein [Klebsiella pneumoniae]MCI7893308.1 hypothetical protein [Klebsiella pneumoniae]MEC5472260.1 hypothetical protein [Klebsiella pneumoniae]HBQ0505916.1 hypothetical protein [Klebsiella pneumoniae]HBR2896389.1 hypothetical protein [Klebsiella pneumoniae]